MENKQDVDGLSCSIDIITLRADPLQTKVMADLVQDGLAHLFLHLLLCHAG